MNDIIIHEVGLRDGLQMEKQTVPFEKKIEWAKKFFKAGIDIVQIGSFVHPVKMPQMADTDKLFEYFNQPGNKPENVILSGLVLNEKGLERGMKCGVQMFCVGVSASETHSMKNTGMSVQDATTRIIAIAKLAKEAGKMVQVSVQSAFGCGFEGAVPEEKVIGIVEKYLEAGFKTISLADTAGHANPQKVERLFSKILETELSTFLPCLHTHQKAAFFSASKNFLRMCTQHGHQVICFFIAILSSESLADSITLPQKS